MSRLTQALIPPSQRQTAEDLHDALDLSRGDVVRKRGAFFIMLVLSGVIAICGVIADSTATVIGAMIIAPLATPIQGMGFGIVTGHPRLVLRSFLWMVAGVAIVIVLGTLFSSIVIDPASLTTNSQITGRTSPQLLDMIAALATGFAGAFAMSRRDLSTVLPGVAISISLVPPLGVVGVCAGQGAFDLAFGALLLFALNALAIVIAASIVFTVAGYAREPSSMPAPRRRRAYLIVALLSLVVLVPLVLNSIVTLALASWNAQIRDASVAWISTKQGSH
ncbi:TIGR00341 family protein, partial [Schumannella luteola]